MLSHLLDSTRIPCQVLQPKELKDEKEEPKEEQGKQTPKRIFDNYQRSDHSSRCSKACNVDQDKYCTKRFWSEQIVSEHEIVKCERGGETRRDKLVSEKSSSKLRQDRIVGKRERHNKVCTSKGLRDRRVRLSAHTAIQFYDIQDRLGYDQPSKAIDWLIEKAKSAIQVQSQDHDLVYTNDYMEHMKHVLRAESLYHPQCSSNTTDNQQESEKINIDDEAIFSMTSQFQDCLDEQNQTQAHFLSLQSYEDPFSSDVQHSSPICFTEQVLNCTNNLAPYSNSLNSTASQPLLIQKENQFFSQRGTLQSSSLLSLLASTNPTICVHGHANSQSPNSNLLSTNGFSSGGFVGF